MAGVINTLILGKAQGFDKASDQIDAARRSFTRLGQEAPSAGRKFSAQSKGLGGLVAAYAGAAATIFALQQAFSALNKAAVAENTIKGTRTLALEIGEAGDVIISKIREISKSQLSLAETARNVNLALSAGFSGQQIEDITDISLKASRALGRNLTDALQRIVRGAGKLEPELLDELGIFTRIEPAVQKYADALNRSVSSLTNYERRQAFVNAVIEEGQRKFSEIDTTTETSQEKLEKFTASIVDLATEIGGFLADVVGSITGLFDDKIGNTLLAFIALAGLVLAKGISVLKGGFESLEQSALRFLDKRRISAGGEELVKVFTAASSKLNDFNLRTLAFDKNLQKSISNIKDAGIKSISELQNVVGAVSRSIVNAREKADQAQAKIEAAVGTKRSTKGAQADLQRANEQIKLRKEILEAFEKDLEKADKLAQNRVTRLANTAIKAVQFTATAVTTAVKGIVGIIGLLGTAQIVGNIIGAISGYDIDILGEIRDLLKSIGQEAKNTKLAFEGLFSAFGEKDLLDSLGTIGLTAKDLQKTIKDVTERVAGISRDSSSAAAKAITSFRRLPGDPEKAFFGREIDAQITRFEEKLAKATTPKDAQLAAATVKILKFYKNLNEEGQIAVTDIFAPIVAKTGLSFTQLGKLVKEKTFSINKDTKEVIINFEGVSGVIGKVTSNFKAQLNPQLIDAASGIALAKNRLDTLRDAFNRGAVDAEKFSQQVGAFKTTIDNLEKLRDVLDAQDIRFKFLDDAIKKGKELLKIEEKRKEELIAITTLNKQLTDLFGSDIKKSETAFVSGLINSAGVISKSAEESTANQNALLAEQIKRIDNLNKKKAIAGKLNATEEEQLKAGNRSLKIAFARYLDIEKELDKILTQEEKRLATLKEQNDAAEIQAAILVKQASIKLTQAQNQFSISRLENSKEIIQIEGEIRELAIQTQIAQSQGASQRLQAIERIKELESSILDLENERLKLNIEKQFDLQINRLQSMLNILNNFSGGLISPNKLLDKQFELEQLRNRKQLELLNLEEKLIIRKNIEELARLDRQEKALGLEGANIALQVQLIKEQFNNKRIQLDREREINVEKARNEREQLQNERALFELQTKAQLLNLENQKNQQLRDLDILRKRVELLVKQRQVFEEFLTKFKDLIVEAIKAINPNTNVTKDSLNTTFAPIDEKSVLIAIDKSKAAINTLFKTQTDGINKAAELERKRFDVALKQNAESIVQLNKVYELTLKKLDAEEKLAIIQAQSGGVDLALRRQEIEKQRELAKKQLEIDKLRIQNQRDTIVQAEMLAKREKELLKDTVVTFVNGFVQNINDALADGIEKLSKSFFEDGKIDFAVGAAEVARIFLDNVRKNATENLIIKPLQGLVSDTLGPFFSDLLGIGGKKDGQTATSAWYVRFAEDAGPIGALKKILPGAFEGSDKKGGASSITTVIKDLFDSNGLLARLLRGLGDIATDVFSFIGQALGSVIRAISGGFGFASGGRVGSAGALRRAMGGSIPRMASGGLRDRIGTYLEPGEFVFRRYAAQRIGLNKLQQMNATGKTSGNAGSVSVNITNKGTPQENEGTPKIKFDGERMIVDIVLRDLNNNGPIRQGIKGLRK